MKDFKYNGKELNISTSILADHGFLHKNSINPRASESLFNDEIEDMQYTTAVLMNEINELFYSTDYSVVDLGKQLMQKRNALLKTVAQVGLHVLQYGEEENHVSGCIKKLYSTKKEQAIPYGEKESSVLYVDTTYEIKTEDTETFFVSAKTSLNISNEYPNVERIILLCTENTYSIGKDETFPANVQKENAAIHFEKFCNDIVNACDDISKFIPGSCAFEDIDDAPIKGIEYYQFRAADDLSDYSEYIDVIGNAVLPSKDYIEMTRILIALLSTDSTEVENEMFNLNLMGFTNWDILNFMLYGNAPEISSTQDPKSGCSYNFLVNYWGIISSEFTW